MPDYRESTSTTKSWRRAYSVRLDNPINDPNERSVVFSEEDVVEMGDRTITTPVSTVRSGFTPEATFELVNPLTGELLGQTVSHQELYIMLASLYLDLAAARDLAAIPEPEPEGQGP